MTTYKTKMETGLIIPIAMLLGFGLYISITNDSKFGMIILSILITAGVYLYFQTKYIISGTILIVKLGVLMKWRIPIQEIKCITRPNNLLNLNTFKANRIQIFYGKLKQITISPKDRDAFITELLEINSYIKCVRIN